MIPANTMETYLAMDWRLRMRVLRIGRNRGFVLCKRLMASALVVLTISLSSCKKQESPAATEAAQKMFTSPDEAGKALADAAKADDRNVLLAIFGPGSKDVIIPVTPRRTRRRLQVLPLPTPE
jgi:hypothetical protein